MSETKTNSFKLRGERRWSSQRSEELFFCLPFIPQLDGKNQHLNSTVKIHELRLANNLMYHPLGVGSVLCLPSLLLIKCSKRVDSRVRDIGYTSQWGTLK